MSFVSQRLKQFDSGDFRQAMFKQQLLRDPINLSIGVPEELTAEHVKAAGIKAIRDDHTVYTPSNGIFDLRDAVANKLRDENNIYCSSETVSIVPGLTTGQLLVYLATLDPGDEVIVFDPYYPPFVYLANMIGARAVCAPTTIDFQPDIEALKLRITNKTKMIVINTPNNPSGAVYPEATIRQIAELAEANNLLILSDEIYEHFNYDSSHFSVGSIYPNTITMNGFSKEFAMTGWRVGYITGPPEIINAVNELLQYVVFSSSSISQHAALAALSHRPDLTQKYKAKRDFVVRTLQSLDIDVHGAQGAFYVFFKAPGNLTDIEFVEKATDHNLILVPGKAFSNLKGFVRISYGADQNTLEKGMDALTRAVKSIGN